MAVAIAGLIGLLLGPLLHGRAVEAGADLPFSFRLTCPRGHADESGTLTRCTCGRLRWREAATALGAAVGFAGMTAALGLRWVLVAHLAMVALTLMLIVTDFDHFRIPNRLLFPGGVLCLALLAVGAGLDRTWRELLWGLVGAVVYYGLMLLVFLAARGEGFGFGDVKLAALLGLFGGFHGIRILAYSFFITALLGGIPALVLLAMGRGRKTAIPYGPPLIIGTWAAITFAARLLA